MKQSYAVLGQVVGNHAHGVLKLLVVCGVEAVYFLYRGLGPHPVGLGYFLLRLGNAAERCHTDAEKLVEVV